MSERPFEDDILGVLTMIGQELEKPDTPCADLREQFREAVESITSDRASVELVKKLILTFRSRNPSFFVEMDSLRERLLGAVSVSHDIIFSEKTPEHCWKLLQIVCASEVNFTFREQALEELERAFTYRTLPNDSDIAEILAAIPEDDSLYEHIETALAVREDAIVLFPLVANRQWQLLLSIAADDTQPISQRRLALLYIQNDIIWQQRGVLETSELRQEMLALRNDPHKEIRQDALKILRFLKAYEGGKL